MLKTPMMDDLKQKMQMSIFPQMSGVPAEERVQFGARQDKQTLSSQVSYDPVLNTPNNGSKPSIGLFDIKEGLEQICQLTPE